MDYNFRDKLWDALKIMGPTYLKPKFRKYWTPECPVAGYCYVVSEVLYHIMKEHGHEFAAYVMKVQMPGVYNEPDEVITHWFLKSPKGKIVDFTREQFPFKLNYEKGIRKFFLTSDMSKRAQVLYNLLIALSGSLNTNQKNIGESEKDDDHDGNGAIFS